MDDARARLIYVLGFFALLLLCFAPALPGGAVWDDRPMVVDNLQLRSASGLRAIWLQPGATFQYYPLTYTSFWIEHQLWGTRFPSMRIINLLLHLLCGLMLYQVLRQWEVPSPWLITALWTVHPLQVESLVWVAERKTVLSALLFLAALRVLAPLIVQPAGSKAPRWIVPIGLLLYALALAAKPAAVTLPAVVLLLAWRSAAPMRKALMALLAAMGVLSIASSLLTFTLERSMTGHPTMLSQLALGQRIALAGKSIAISIAHTLVPIRQALFYPPDGTTIAWGLIWVLGIALVVWSYRRQRELMILTLLFVVLLSPTLGFVDFGYLQFSVTADRFSYLAIVPVLIVVMGAVPARRRSIVVVIATIAFCLAGTLRANDFRSERTLFQREVEKHPDAWMAHVQLGLLELRSGTPERAIPHLQAALRLQPESDLVHHRLAFALARTGQVQPARAEFERALTLQPSNHEARNDYANFLADQGEFDAARLQFERVLSSSGVRVETLVNYANLLLRSGDLPAAEANYRRALDSAPLYAPAHNGLGALLLRRQEFARALASFENAVRLDPANRSYRQNAERARGALDR